MKPSFCNSNKTFKAWETEKTLKGFSENTKYQKKEIKRLNGKTTVNCEQHQFVKKHGFFRRLLALLATVFTIGIACTSTTIREWLVGKKVIYVDVAKASPAIQKADKVAQDKQVIPKRAEKKAVPAPKEKTSETKPSDPETNKKETADTITQVDQEDKKAPTPTQKPTKKEPSPTKPSDTEKGDPETALPPKAEPTGWEGQGEEFVKLFKTTDGFESAEEETSSFEYPYRHRLARTFSQVGAPFLDKNEGAEKSRDASHQPPLLRQDTIRVHADRVQADLKAKAEAAKKKASGESAPKPMAPPPPPPPASKPTATTTTAPPPPQPRKRRGRKPAALDLPEHLVALANTELKRSKKRKSPPFIFTCTSFIKYLRNRIATKEASEGGLFRIPGYKEKVGEIVGMLQKQKLSEIMTRQEEFSLYDLLTSLTRFINKNNKKLTKAFDLVCKIELDRNTNKTITIYRRAVNKLESDKKVFLANLCVLLITVYNADPEWKDKPISNMLTNIAITLEGIITKPLPLPLPLHLKSPKEQTDYCKKVKKEELKKVKFLLENAGKIFTTSSK